MALRVEAANSPLCLHTNPRYLDRIERLRITPSASYLQRRFLNLPRTCMGHLASRPDHLIGPLFSLGQVRRRHPPYTSREILTEISCLRKKSLPSYTVRCRLVAYALIRYFPATCTCSSMPLPTLSMILQRWQPSFFRLRVGTEAFLQDIINDR